MASDFTVKDPDASDDVVLLMLEINAQIWYANPMATLTVRSSMVIDYEFKKFASWPLTSINDQVRFLALICAYIHLEIVTV